MNSEKLREIQNAQNLELETRGVVGAKVTIERVRNDAINRRECAVSGKAAGISLARELPLTVHLSPALAVRFVAQLDFARSTALGSFSLSAKPQGDSPVWELRKPSDKD